MEYTPIGEVTAVARPAADRAAAYGLEASSSTATTSRRCTRWRAAAIDRARAGEGPVAGGGRDLPPRRALARRSRQLPAGGGGQAAWLARDPIPRERARLGGRGRADAELDAIEAEATRRSPPPRPRRRAAPPGADRRRPRDPGLGRWRLGMAELTYRQARGRRHRPGDGARRHVVMLGEDIGAAGGVFKTDRGPAGPLRPDRVRDTPISEQAIIGAAMGAAMTGLRPVAELMFSDFFGVAWDMVANQIAKTRYMTDGQVSLPLVIRTANGGGLRFGAQHSQTIENWAMAIPGLKVVAPSTPADMVGLMAAAIRDPDPVIVCEHKALFADKGDVPRARSSSRSGEAAVRARGPTRRWSRWPRWCRAPWRPPSAGPEDGIDAEVIDLRSLVPLDVHGPRIGAQDARLFTVEENPRLCAGARRSSRSSPRRRSTRWTGRSSGSRRRTSRSPPTRCSRTRRCPPPSGSPRP